MLDRLLIPVAIALLAIGWLALGGYVSDETALGLRNLVFIVSATAVGLCAVGVARDEWRSRHYPE